MNIWLIIYLIIAHYIADFIFQDEEWATNKSKDIRSLLKHTYTYSFVFTLLVWLIFPWYIAFTFFSTMLLSHTAIDYVTSKIVSRKFQNKEYGSSIPNFGAFSIIGFDQVLHYITIFLTLDFVL